MIDVKISPKALMKMQTLVMGYDKEVGWYGLVDKVGQYEYRITDILVFPQYTSSVFVDDTRDDPEEHRKWLDGNLSDEEYEHRRLWGHSHVNMGVSPSGTDLSMFDRQKHVMSAAKENKFILCVILNKRLEMFWWAYDAEEGKEYKDKEINVMFEVEEGMTNVEYFENSLALVRDIRSTTELIFRNGNHNSNTKAGYNYGGYNKHVEEKEKKKNNVTDINSYFNDYCDDYYDDYYDEYYNNYIAAYGSEDEEDDECEYNNYSIQITQSGKCKVLEMQYINISFYDAVFADIEDNYYGLSVDKSVNIPPDSVLDILLESFTTTESQLYSYFLLIDSNGDLIPLPKDESIADLLKKECISEEVIDQNGDLALYITLKEY